MKSRLFPVLFSFFLVLLFLQTNFAQNQANKNYYSINTDENVVTRPRVYTEGGTDETEKTVNNAERKVSKAFDLEHRAFDLINQERAKAGLAPLRWNEELARVARGHSQNMAANHFFSHTGLDGKMVNGRADDAGVKNWFRIGENIAYNRGFSDPTGSAVASWMNSDGHRANILNADWKEAGIGIVVTENGTYYFTQVFLLKK